MRKYLMKKAVSLLLFAVLLVPVLGCAQTVEGKAAPYTAVMPDTVWQMTGEAVQQMRDLLVDNPGLLADQGYSDEMLAVFEVIDITTLDYYIYDIISGGNITVTGQDTGIYTNAQTELVMVILTPTVVSNYAAMLGIPEDEIAQTGVMETEYGKMFGFQVSIQYGESGTSIWDIYMIGDNHYLYEIAFTNVPDDDVAQILSTFKPL